MVSLLSILSFLKCCTLSYWWYHVGSHPKSHILGFCKRGIKLSGIVLFSHAWELGIHLVGYRNTHFAHTHEVLASNLKSIKGGGDYHSDPYEIRNVEHYWYPLSYKVIFPDDSCNNDRKQHVPSFSGHVELLSHYITYRYPMSIYAMRFMHSKTVHERYRSQMHLFVTIK